MKIENLGVREEKKLLAWLYNKVTTLLGRADTDDNEDANIASTVSNHDTRLTAAEGNITTLQQYLPYPIVVLTQAQYDLLDPPNTDTIYMIKA